MIRLNELIAKLQLIQAVHGDDMFVAVPCEIMHEDKELVDIAEKVSVVGADRTYDEGRLYLTEHELSKSMEVVVIE